MVKASVLAACFAVLAQAVSAECRLALALGLDVSASVDASEYRLQLDGLSAALGSAGVRDALLAAPESPVALAVFEWSGRNDQRLLIPWTVVLSPQHLREIRTRLGATTRRPMDDSTALGTALLYGQGLLSESPGCAQWVLDVSGDGKNNDGVPPEDVTAQTMAGVTVNALVIGADVLDQTDRRQAQIGELSSYFNAHVIRGPGAFVQVALGFRDYERAMTRKLLREIQSFALSAAPG